MHILIVHDATLPVSRYGGTERVIWYLGKELAKAGNKVSYLARKDSICDFAKIIPINHVAPIQSQIPEDVDVVHYHYSPMGMELTEKPYIFTLHGNPGADEILNKNTVFVSKNHACRHGSESFVYNGMDWDSYEKPIFNNSRKYFHFLGNAAWRIKNVQGAIDVVTAMPNERLHVIGGKRFNFSMGVRLSFSLKIRFHGMVDDKRKSQILKESKGLLFPVRWHEPFGLAIIESLYYGCPVFGTSYGSLPELVHSDVGLLSNSKTELMEAMIHWESYSQRSCHEYARNEFNSLKMMNAYLQKYEQVINGGSLNNINPKLSETSKNKFLPWNP
jgi:glycosyltransferase involved in cell wall biosynthesis